MKTVEKNGGKHMLVLVYRKCSTCLKALKWLEAHNVEFEERAIVENNPTYEELKAWYEKSGLPLKKFFNTSGLLYKDMGLKDKLPAMSEEEQLQEEVSYPGIELHKVKHAEFKKAIHELYEMLREEEGPTDAFVDAVTKNVRDWFYDHIKGFDSSVASYINLYSNGDLV